MKGDTIKYYGDNAIVTGYSFYWASIGGVHNNRRTNITSFTYRSNGIGINKAIYFKEPYPLMLFEKRYIGNYRCMLIEKRNRCL